MKILNSWMILLFLAMSFCLIAQAHGKVKPKYVTSEKFSRLYGTKQDGWRVVVRAIGDYDRLEVYSRKTGKLLCRWVDHEEESYFSVPETNEVGPLAEQEDHAGVFRLRDYPRPLLVTRWHHGVHSEKLRVFDPSLKVNPLVKEFSSAWPTQYKVEDGYLEVTLMPDNSGPGGTPTKVLERWRP